MPGHRAIGWRGARPNQSGKGRAMLRLVMLPSNAVCDLLRLEDEHERGMVRMLVNTLLWLAIPITILTVAWIA